jgi:acyl carrier protein
VRAETLTILIEEASSVAKGRPVTAATSIIRDLGLDSLAVMNFVMVLEDRFDLSIPIDMIADVETVEDLARVVSSLQTRKAAK